jgi:hypothetical protein
VITNSAGRQILGATGQSEGFQTHAAGQPIAR